MSEATPHGTVGGTPPAASSAPAAGASPGASLAVKTWNNVNQPGCYVCNVTGRLLRVPVSGLKEGNTPVIEFLGPQGPSRVTRISDDPCLPLADLRLKSTAASGAPQF